MEAAREREGATWSAMGWGNEKVKVKTRRKGGKTGDKGANRGK